MKPEDLNALKLTLAWESFLILFLFVNLIVFFWRHKTLETLFYSLLLLAGLIAIKFREWSDPITVINIKSWGLLTVFFLVALSPYLGFILRKFFLPKHLRKFLARGGPLDEIVVTCEVLSHEKVGALIAVERRDSLKQFSGRGVSIDSKVKRQLLVSLFAPNTPTHDGGVVITGDRIAACSTIFPLSHKNIHGMKLGTRHRGALGLSEETDALVIIVSEETGKISIARDGKLHYDISLKHLSKLIRKLIL
jgi:diadenylate cyclase